MAEDNVDVWLSQAQMVAFCIPEVGPILAAASSIAKALYDSYGKSDQPPRYSMPAAIADLGTVIQKMLKAQEHDQVMSMINGWEAEVIKIQRETKSWVDDDSADLRAIVDGRIANFEENLDFETLLASFSGATNTPKSEERVKSLDTYFKARTAYHSMLHAKLAWIARAYNLHPDQWVNIAGDVAGTLHDSLQQSFDDAITYAESTVTMLEEAYAEYDNFTESKLADVRNPIKRNKLITTKLRALNATSHLNYADEDQVKRYKEFLLAYKTSKQYIAAQPTLAHWEHGTASTGDTPVVSNPTAPSKPKTHLGPRPAQHIRILYETAKSGGWVGVLKNSPAQRGALVSQNAGSSDSALYYQVRGGTLNQEFQKALTASGELAGVDQSLIAAYNAAFNNSYAADANAGRGDRLTSFLIPLDASTHKGGKDVMAMMYSVGPKLGNAGLTKNIETVYQGIYEDAFNAIADYNGKYKPAITLFRLTLISTEAYAGTSDKAALRKKSAELVLNAAATVAAKKPAIADLTLLVNSNENNGGEARVAFDAAAKTLSLTTTGDGFDLPF